MPRMPSLATWTWLTEEYYLDINPNNNPVSPEAADAQLLVAQCDVKRWTVAPLEEYNMCNGFIRSLLNEPAEAFPCCTVIASGSGMVSLLRTTETKGLIKGKCVDLDGDIHPTGDGEHQETREIRFVKRDILLHQGWR